MNNVEQQQTTAQTPSTTTVSYVKHPESIKTVLVDQFPTIEVGHQIYATKTPRVKNWSTFFSKLEVGAVFNVMTNKEAQAYYMNAYQRDIKLSRKKQPGGIIRMQRTK